MKILIGQTSTDYSPTTDILRFLLILLVQLFDKKILNYNNLCLLYLQI